MKNKIIMLCALFISFNVFALGDPCVDEKAVEYIDIGNLSSANNGSDSNSAIIVTFSGSPLYTISLPQSGNLNDASGQGSYAMLLSALAAGNKITAWGNSSCSYINTFRIHKI